MLFRILLEKISTFWRYYSKAKTIYKVHSPFVYSFIDEVIKNDHMHYAFEILESHRKNILQSKETVMFQEMGAGSKVLKNQNATRQLSEIAKSALAPANQARILFHLVNKYHRKNVLEIGTSLGLSTLYMLSANSKMQMTTMEGNAEVLSKAIDAFNQFGFHCVKTVLGNFDDTLQNTLESGDKYDLVYVDGNHSYEATKRYWSQILPYCTPDAIIVFDDIHWSKGMYEAWEEIKNDQAVRARIEIYDLGFVFLDLKLAKNNFTFIDFWWKPWQIGLFL